MVTNKNSKPVKLWLFWPYDNFPGCLWAEVLSVSEKTVVVEGYGKLGRSDKQVLVPEVQALPLIEELITLVENYDSEISKVKHNYSDLLITTFKRARVAKPCE